MLTADHHVRVGNEVNRVAAPVLQYFIIPAAAGTSQFIDTV